MIFAEKDVLKRWPEVRRYYAISYPFYSMNPQTHPEWELMYVAQGRCIVSYWEQGRQIDQSLREGEYILLGGSVQHQLTVEKGTPCRILNLEGRLVPALGEFRLEMLADSEMFRNFVAAPGEVETGMDDGTLQSVILALQRELKASETKKEIYLNTAWIFGQLLLILARQYAEHRKKQPGGSIYIRRAAAFLNEHFDESFSAAQAAQAAGISEAYLQRLFRQATGHSLMEEARRMRIEKAKLLLETSSLPVIDVALSSGFNSRQHFTEVFTQWVGCSPAAYRKNRGGHTGYQIVDIK